MIKLYEIKNFRNLTSQKLFKDLLGFSEQDPSISIETEFLPQWVVHFLRSLLLLLLETNLIQFAYTTQKMRFSFIDFFSKYNHVHRKLRIWSPLLKKSLLENFIFCALIRIFSCLCNLSSAKSYFLKAQNCSVSKDIADL